MLRHGLRAAGCLSRIWPIVESVQRHLGRDETVWGLKYSPERLLGCELYFYNNADNPPGHPMAVTKLVEVLAPHVRVDSVLDESIPYFMCSVDFDVDDPQAGADDGFRIYVGTRETGRTPAGFSYRVKGDVLSAQNHYAFYYADRPEDLADVRGRLASSPRAGSEAHHRELLPEYLLPCRTVCYAVKPGHDGLYFSRVTTAQLTAFLSRHLEGPLKDLLSTHADEFAHLRWDLGFDYCIARDSDEPLRLPKMGVYGVV